MDEEELLEEVGRLQSDLGNVSFYKALNETVGMSKTGHAEICPLSLLLGRTINLVHIDDISAWEYAAESYKQLPFEGGWLSQIAWVMDALNYVRLGKDQAKNAIQKDMMPKESKSKGSR